MLAEVWENPIFVRARRVEDRRLGFGLKGFIYRYGTGIMMVLGPLALTMFLTFPEMLLHPQLWIYKWLGRVLGFTAFLMVMYVAVRSVNATASTISAEREGKTYESLLATRLSPREFLLGKLAAGLWPVTRELLAAAPLALALGLLGGHPLEAGLFVLIALASNLLFGMVGTWSSYAARTTQEATQKGLATAAFLLLAGPLVDYMVRGLAFPESSFLPAATMTSPLAACYSILSIGLGHTGLWSWAWAGTLAMYAVLIVSLWTSLQVSAARARCH